MEIKKKKERESRREGEREGLFCFDVFESGIRGQLGFFSSPLIDTACSETHRGLFRLGVCSGGRPSVSAPRLGTATAAAPGGPVRHKTSRGRLALPVACFHLGSRARVIPGTLSSRGGEAAGGRGGLHLGKEGFLRPGRERAGLQAWGRCRSGRAWVPRGPGTKLAVCGPDPGLGRSAVAGAPGNPHTGRPLGDDELDQGLSGEAGPRRAGQRCAPGPRQATAEAAPASLRAG